MTCVKTGSAIVCFNPWGRLHVNGKYIYVDYHEYCGPAFWRDQNCSKPYEPVDETDPVWPEFGKWFEKFHAAKEKQKRKQLRGET